MVKCNLKIIQPVSVYNVSIQIGDHKKLDLSGTLSSTKMLNAPIKVIVSCNLLQSLLFLTLR